MILLSRSKGHRSNARDRFGWLYWQADMDIELATDPYACMMYIVSPLTGLGGGRVRVGRERTGTPFPFFFIQRERRSGINNRKTIKNAHQR